MPDPNPDQEFVTEFDPADFMADEAGVYSFTEIIVDADVRVRISAEKVYGPVYWLVDGDVVINGTIDLSGEDGQDGQTIPNDARPPSLPGAGGFYGGVGGTRTSLPQPGFGPGGGLTQGGGGGAGHADQGTPGRCSCPYCTNGGAAYGNGRLFGLLMGGSGGAGGVADGNNPDNTGGTGGAGGGAIQISSSTEILIDGAIFADGGRGGDAIYPGRNTAYAGGGGSGGTIRLVAPTISGSGVLSVAGGAGGTGHDFTDLGGCLARRQGHGGAGSAGRIRLEASNLEFDGTENPVALKGTPLPVFLPMEPAPRLRISRIVGADATTELPDAPGGDFADPDALIEEPGRVVIEIEGRFVPPETVVNLHLMPEDGQALSLASSPLTGDLNLSVGSVALELPFGFSRLYLTATW